MPQQILYKYRSLDNFKFLLDIFLEKRLYAASFRSLNDPMEGRYSYHGDDVSRAFINSVRRSKDKLKICSLSSSPRNTLMWSYYGGGHSGVVLGVVVRPRRGQQVKPVTYDREVAIGLRHQSQEPLKVALEILSQKQLNWQHEKEVRVFSRSQFVSVELKRVLLGCQMPEEDRKLVRKLVKTTSPQVRVKALRREDLDREVDLFGA